MAAWRVLHVQIGIGVQSIELGRGRHINFARNREPCAVMPELKKTRSYSYVPPCRPASSLTQLVFAANLSGIFLTPGLGHSHEAEKAGMDRLETQLPATDDSPREARAFLRAALHTWELDSFGEVAAVLTSELVTNVVRHVGAPMTLRALRHASTIRIEVDDPSTDPPVPQRPHPHDEYGRGLFLVESLADAWGVTPYGDGGKTVWAEIDATNATDEVHGR